MNITGFITTIVVAFAAQAVWAAEVTVQPPVSAIKGAQPDAPVKRRRASLYDVGQVLSSVNLGEMTDAYKKAANAVMVDAFIGEIQEKGVEKFVSDFFAGASPATYPEKAGGLRDLFDLAASKHSSLIFLRIKLEECLGPYIRPIKIAAPELSVFDFEDDCGEQES